MSRSLRQQSLEKVMLTRLEEIRHEITGERLELIEFARKLRRDATDAEALLWSCLRDRRVNRRKFRRQHPLEPYVLDFLLRGTESGD